MTNAVQQAIKLFKFPRRFGIPNLSPFCCKLETWLRIAGIPLAPLGASKQPWPGSKPIPAMRNEHVNKVRPFTGSLTPPCGQCLGALAFGVQGWPPY